MSIQFFNTVDKLSKRVAELEKSQKQLQAQVDELKLNKVEKGPKNDRKRANSTT